jgi:hypothetical protein
MPSAMAHVQPEKRGVIILLWLQPLLGLLVRQ